VDSGSDSRLHFQTYRWWPAPHPTPLILFLGNLSLRNPRRPIMPYGKAQGRLPHMNGWIYSCGNDCMVCRIRANYATDQIIKVQCSFFFFETKEEL
jgi:hypothetical protein